MKELEIWKDVPKYEGLYQVSNLGRVKSLFREVVYKDGRSKYVQETIFAINLNTGGYPYVQLSKEGRRKVIETHKLVAIVFLNHKPNGHTIEVDHIDNNKLNNKLSNLQLINHRKNCSKDKKGHSSKYIGVTYDKSRNKWLSQIRIKGETKARYLGRFNKEIDAANAYQKALKQLENGNL